MAKIAFLEMRNPLEIPAFLELSARKSPTRFHEDPINDVGPLKTGRVIDLNEQAMRYFDPTLRLGLIPQVRVTALLGDDWTTGPIQGGGLIRVASQREE